MVSPADRALADNLIRAALSRSRVGSIAVRASDRLLRARLRATDRSSAEECVRVANDDHSRRAAMPRSWANRQAGAEATGSSITGRSSITGSQTTSTRAEECIVPATPQEIFGRYLHGGALMRDADALAELFAEDGVLEAPLVPAGHVFPSRLAGREAIRTGMAAYYQRSAGARGPVAAGTVDAAKSGYVLHHTTDPSPRSTPSSTWPVRPCPCRWYRLSRTRGSGRSPRRLSLMRSSISS